VEVDGLVRQEDLPLMVDLYELAMVQAYWAEGMKGTAVFSLFFRQLPEHRNFILACGQQHVARLVSRLRFTDDHIERLRKLDRFRPEFLEWLRDFRFSGTIRAVAEGTPLFPQEPLLEVEAPIAEAQLLESLVMNYVHLETVLASKAVRLKLAAGDRPVVDFGMRRMHGLDAAHRGIRAFRTAGLSGTSNVLAGQDFGLQVSGTMAHSFVQACDSEMRAFEAYADLYPGTTLLVDTYDSQQAVKRIVEWLKSSNADISAIRLDSGDLLEESRACRAILDEAGFSGVRIMASGGLDEYRIRDQGAPIDGFGVGTAIGVANDAPALELAYKLTEYGGKPKMKNSPGKRSYPGAKQVFRQYDQTGTLAGDMVAGIGEQHPGVPLLRRVLASGHWLEPLSLEDQVSSAAEAVAALPERLKGLEVADPVSVTISDDLQALQQSTLAELQG
jgi:nicotinate phosphoribosyltransferase